ncbi:CU044_5270 family protein [Saccharopolyspora sp. NPDC050389]|uniref:CU044_5270 family protein n=1 Tax=Saccharopolyspora sp. NPDC050389 TaxID=3155516 RepID=UPI00340C8B4E
MKAMRRGPREEVDRAELAHLLPSPAEPELSGERHTVLRENLMREIHQQPRTHARPARSRRWALAAVPLTIAAITAGVFVLQSGPNAGQAAAAEQLGRISAAAAAKPEPQIRPDQYVYIRSVGADSTADGDTDGPFVLGPVQEREIWFAQRQVAPGTVVGAIREGSDPMYELIKHADQTPTYEELKKLPTDPDALLAWVRENSGSGGSKDRRMFDKLGDLIQEALLPPDLAAAVYQAAAKIPGVELGGEAQDAEGRTGLVVSYLDEDAGMRKQWIFDPQTLEYLGKRTVLAEDSSLGAAGALVETKAVLERDVVDGIGQVPSGQ